MNRNILIISILLLLIAGYSCRQERDVTLILPEKVAPRVSYGVKKLKAELLRNGYQVSVATNDIPTDKDIFLRIGYMDEYLNTPFIGDIIPEKLKSGELLEEGFILTGNKDQYLIAGQDASGILYGCLELIERIKEQGKIPENISFTDAPRMKLRGTCIGMQKTYVLPDFGMYNYPYTPELFPFFYDKALWIKYLDMLVENRYNTLYLWSGHPFSSLVKLEDYPYALDVDEATFHRNEEIFRFLTREADKRGIWVVQKFYNIHVGRNFAEHNGIPTHTATSTPLLEDYTRKSIAAFVEHYPNVGLLVCLGEALNPVSADIEWLNRVIIPGVKEGMDKLGTDKEPPIVIRGHNTDPPAVIRAALPYYKNLYTMSKYNGEALTTYHPRGLWAETHRELSRLGSTHIDNVHLLANLEPFRWSSPDFIQKSVEAMHQIHGANGLHLYPQTSYWDWPFSADKTIPRLYEMDRDRLWYQMWGRYAWNEQRDSVQERTYWSGLLEEFYGCPGYGELILDALQESGECAPKGLRRFGITNGNRQCYALGMFMDQLVNRDKYSPWVELWRSDSPEGEGLEEYVEKEMKGLPHTGETPPGIAGEIRVHGKQAVNAIEKVSPFIHKNKEEFARLNNDMHCISLLANFYADKSKSAEYVLRYKYTPDAGMLDSALVWLEKSVHDFEQLTSRTEDTYLCACSLQDKVRRIPNSGEGGKNKHWDELLPYYRQELETFSNRLEKLEANNNFSGNDTVKIKLEAVSFELISEGMEKYVVREGEPVFSDQGIIIDQLRDELRGLTGVRFSEKEYERQGIRFQFRVNVPVYVLVGYFNTDKPGFLPKPNLETDAFANERGGLEPVLRNAITFKDLKSTSSSHTTGYPGVDIHAFRFDSGTQEMGFDKGKFLILGIIDSEKELDMLKLNLTQKPAQINVDWLFE